ncbi:MAG: glucosaminidase domain-containing protein [Roseiflexaceae bacterium]|nr:glucosaminidase domain-containing protein [Roseiflexaceae bacterium]
MTYTADSPLFGTPKASVDQCARFMSSRAHGEYTEHDLRNVLVPAYYRVCGEVGLDSTLVISQLIHETGNLSSWWSQRPRRNPAGIGVTGQKQPAKPAAGAWVWNDQTQLWHEGVAFPAWDNDAIPAHIGRLMAYAMRDDQASTPQRELIARALSYRPLRRYRGEAPTLRGLNGRWAVPGTTYADRLSHTANAIAAT